MSWISPDSQDMLGATAGLADQLEASALMAREVGGLPSPEGLESIVVLGMGGSGVAGEILQAIGKDQLSLPVALVGDYSLPSFVGPSSLVIAVSFSGQTEETLEAAGTAIERGARLLRGDEWGTSRRDGGRGQSACFSYRAWDSPAESRGWHHDRSSARSPRTPGPASWHERGDRRRRRAAEDPT